MSSTGNKKMIRKLGAFESYHLMGEELLHTNIVTYGTIHSLIDESQLRNALNKIQNKHPLLNVFIKTSYFRKPIFVMNSNTSEIPIYIREASYNDRDGILEEILNTILPINKAPLMRLFIIKHPDQVTTLAMHLSHTIADGLSSMRIMGSLLESMDRPEEGTSPKPSVIIMPEAVESNFPQRIRSFKGLINYLKLNMRLISDISSSQKQTIPLPQVEAPIDRRRMIFASRSLGTSEIQMIKETARKEKTSVNAAIAAAHFIALSEAFECNENLSPTFRSMVIMSNADLRRRLGSGYDDVTANFASIANTLVSADLKCGFWDIARNYQEALVKSIEEDEPFLHMYSQKIMQFLTGWAGFNTRSSILLNRLMSRFEQKMTLVSNVGVVDVGPKEGRYKLSSLANISSSRMSQMIYSVTATTNGVLTWNVIGNNPCHSRERLEKLADRMIELIISNS
jgi:NRPS condensation-like uncharacterized protein